MGPLRKTLMLPRRQKETEAALPSGRRSSRGARRHCTDYTAAGIGAYPGATYTKYAVIGHPSFGGLDSFAQIAAEADGARARDDTLVVLAGVDTFITALAEAT